MSQNFQGGGFGGLLVTKFEKFGPELIQYQHLICYSLLSRELNFEFLSVSNFFLQAWWAVLTPRKHLGHTETQKWAPRSFQNRLTPKNPWFFWPYIHISVSFWVSEVFDTSFRPEFWCLWDGGPNLTKFGQIWSLWPKMSIFTTQVWGQKWKCLPPPKILTQWFLRRKNAIFS